MRRDIPPHLRHLKCTLAGGAASIVSPPLDNQPKTIIKGVVANGTTIVANVNDSIAVFDEALRVEELLTAWVYATCSGANVRISRVHV